MLGSQSRGATGTTSPRWTTFDVPVFRNYTKDQGLPNPVITALAEDGDGFLWIGTQGGLARWDGYRFHNYKLAAGIAGALPDNWVTTLHSDSHGRLWIGTSAGGLARFDRDLDRFVTYGAGPEGLSNVHIGSIADDGDNLWIGTEGGVDHLDTSNGHIDTLPLRLGTERDSQDDRVLAVLRDRKGGLWVGTRTGLLWRRVGGDRFESASFGNSSAEKVAITVLLETPDGRIWIGTSKRGVFVIEPGDAYPRPGDAYPRPVLETEATSSSLQNEFVYALMAVAPGKLWVGTYGQGIVVLDTTSGRTKRIRHEPSVPRSLADDTIWALHQDRSGGVWVGTTNGVGRLDSRDGTVTTIDGETSNPRSLSGTDVTAVLPASDGRIWLGLVGKGIDIIDPQVGRLANLPFNAATPDTGLAARVQSMVEEPDGQILIGTNGGVYRADADGTHVNRIAFPGRDPGAGSPALLRANGKLWIGGAADGLWNTVPQDAATSRVEHWGADRLTDLRIVTMLSDASADLWVGTRNGLNRLDTATGEVERILPTPRDSRSLAAGYISTLLLDGSGRLWVGTMGAGIHVLIGREAGKPIFRRIGIDQGLPDGNVDCILADANGRIWVSTDSGIAVIDPASFAVQMLDHADGVAISTYWAHSGAVTQAGELLFGGTGGGLSMIRPELYRPSDAIPPLVITDARLGGKAVLSGRFNGPDNHATFVVPPNANSLSVEFSALDYSSPESNRYAYRLEGFDHDWIETDPTRRTAAYTNLSPGQYTLRLRGASRNSRWNDQSLKMSIRVQPAWFQTFAFRLLAAAIALAAILSLIHRRTIYLRRRQLELELLVVNRTAELEESKRQIEKIAYYDVLTGLPNRRLFGDDIHKLFALAERQSTHFALLLIDLDHFKEINDTLGHDAGDAILIEATKRLQAAVRITDIVARLGGDEFAILMSSLPGTDAGDRLAVDVVSRRVVESFVGGIVLKGRQTKISASIGVALCPCHGTSHETLYKAADLALYDAKRSGRNTWRWHRDAA